MRAHVVKWINGRGFGFLKPDRASARDVFFHVSVVEGGEDTIFYGAAVEYEPQTDSKGRSSASKVRVLSS